MRGSRTMTGTRRSNKDFTRSNWTLFACRSFANGARNARQTARSADVWLRTRRDRPPLVTTHTHTVGSVYTRGDLFVRQCTSFLPNARKAHPLKPRRKRFIRHGSRNLHFKKIFRVPVVDDDKSDGGRNTPPAYRAEYRWDLNTFFWNFRLNATTTAESRQSVRVSTITVCNSDSGANTMSLNW